MKGSRIQLDKRQSRSLIDDFGIPKGEEPGKFGRFMIIVDKPESGISPGTAHFDFFFFTMLKPSSSESGAMIDLSIDENLLRSNSLLHDDKVYLIIHMYKFSNGMSFGDAATMYGTSLRISLNDVMLTEKVSI